MRKYQRLGEFREAADKIKEELISELFNNSDQWDLAR